MAGFVLTSHKGGTLHTGVTADLNRRAREHRDKVLPGFTSKYNVTRLVWYRDYDDITEAIAEEKRIKRWRRRWKIELIEGTNPDWKDLYPILV